MDGGGLLIAYGTSDPRLPHPLFIWYQTLSSDILTYRQVLPASHSGEAAMGANPKISKGYDMRRVAAVVASIVFVAPVFSQDGGGQVIIQQQDGQPRRMGGFGGPGGQGGGRGGMMGGRMGFRMIEELDLDEEQQTVYEELAAPMRERMRAQGEKWRAAREAADAGDDSQMKALQEEMRANGARGGMGPGGGMDGFNDILDQLEPHLRADQVDKLDNMRDRMDRDRESFDNWRKISEEAPDKLNLDEEQRGQFKEMLDNARQQFGEKMGAMRPLMEQMQEAREAGDTAKVAELRAQMEQMRPDGNAGLQALMGQLEGILHDDQKAAFAEFQQEVGVGGDANDAASGNGPDVKSILKAAKRLRLSADQKEDLKLIERQSMRALRSAGRDVDAKAELANRTKEQIERMLEEEQRTRFEQLIERMSRRSKR